MSFFDRLKGTAEVQEPKAKEPKLKTKKKEKTDKLEKEKSEEARETPQKISTTGGQLAIDVYETNESFVIQSTIAGVKSENLDIAIENDMVTIQGERQKSTTEEEPGKYYYQECFWGSFSRQVILPEEVDGSKAEAKIKDGVLTLTIPKAKTLKKKKITVQQEE